MSERFSYKLGKYYDKGVELSQDDVCNLLNDNSNEISRLQEVIDNLHDDLRNQARKKRKMEQIIINLNEIIENYQIIYETLR